MKNFQHRSDKVRIALLGYMKPVHGLPDHRRLFFFSHVTNSIRVRLAPCVAYTYLRLSRKLIFTTFNFHQCAQRRKFNRRKFLQTKVSTDKNFPIYGTDDSSYILDHGNQPGMVVDGVSRLIDLKLAWRCV